MHHQCPDWAPQASCGTTRPPQPGVIVRLGSAASGPARNHGVSAASEGDGDRGASHRATNTEYQRAQRDDVTPPLDRSTRTARGLVLDSDSDSDSESDSDSDSESDSEYDSDSVVTLTSVLLQFAHRQSCARLMSRESNLSLHNKMVEIHT